MHQTDSSLIDLGPIRPPAAGTGTRGPMSEDYSWDSENVGIACGVSIGAGLATGIGGLVVFAPQLLASVSKGTILAIALAISAGVMLYVSFIEIFVKSHEAILTQVSNEAGAAGEVRPRRAARRPRVLSHAVC